MNELVPVVQPPDDQALDRIRSLVLDSVNSPQSKRAYARGVDGFLRWVHQSQHRSGFTKAVVMAYRSHLIESGLSSSAVNLRLTAIKKLAQEGSDNGLVDRFLADGISRVPGVPRLGSKLGNWLDSATAERLIRLPDTSTLSGKRDRALLALMLGSGLRRAEVAILTVDHVQMREARWLLLNVKGKGGRVRSVPIPSFSKSAMDDWLLAAGIVEGKIFRGVNKGDKLSSAGMGSQSIYIVIKRYAETLGIKGLAPHDLRRTFAKLAHVGKAEVDQISISLGHASIMTTQRYLGIEQSIQNAPCDHLNLKP